MRLKKFVNELASKYGKGLTILDVDETVFSTKALIYVVDDETGKVVKKLTNQEFNTYKLLKGFSFDFREFRDAELFYNTSIPINSTIKRIKRIFKNIDNRGSKVIMVTARADFDNKNIFLQTFRDHGIPIDEIYVERAGNIKGGTTAQKKEKIIMKYLNTGSYRRIRLLDDDMENIRQFLRIEKKLPKNLIELIKKKHDIIGDETIKPVEFYGLLVLPGGKLKRIV